jgi:pimeloyl-ACP methyl ester carboxylesterase
MTENENELLKIAPFLGSGELWIEPSSILSRSWRTVTYDHRGSAISTHSGRINAHQLIDDLFAVMDATRIRTCVLAGESMGATDRLSYRSSGEAAAQLLQAAREQDIVSAMPTINIPALIIHGSLDRIVPVAMAETLAAEITGSKLVIIDGVGHVAILTRPRLVAKEINSSFGQE